MLQRCAPLPLHNSRLLYRLRPSTVCQVTTRCRTYSSSQARPLVVLGVESSADDSCCAIVTSDRRILANEVVKQHTQNAKYGGIHPLRAQEAHLVGVPQAISNALSKSNIKLDQVDAIAYTRGPGMFGCLSVGATAARALAAGCRKPLIGVHHMQAHALTPLLTEPQPPSFPFLVLLVSGGHTQLVLCLELDRFEILLDKLDNSIGGAFDRAAKTLALPPSPTKGPGAILEEFAAQAPDALEVVMDPLPVAFRHLSKEEYQRPLAFSFAGLLSALERSVGPTPPSAELQKVGAKRFQVAAVAHLALQVSRTIARLPPEVRAKLGGLVVSGGVASNQYLRHQLRGMLDISAQGVPLFCPPIALCTDNAAMIAWTAILRLQAGRVPPEGESADLPLRAKWSLEDLTIDEKQHAPP